MRITGSSVGGWRLHRRAVLAAMLSLRLAGALYADGADPVESSAGTDAFPDFITSNEDYFVTRIGRIPEIDADSYQLKVGGLVDAPRSFSLSTLYEMANTEVPLTVECIGNSPGGSLLSTAMWRGIPLYDFLLETGIATGATGVRYEAADGYYASHTLEQIRDNGVLLALFMNGEPIPPRHGFPVRVLNPGYYGVKQPAWVTSIELIDRPLEDYWADRGWDVSPPMAIDSRIFRPESRATVAVREPLRLAGAAFGGTRVARVEVTTDHGASWTDARIVQRIDADHVWVFWEAEVAFTETGTYSVNVRATDVHGATQTESDPDGFDGSNAWPGIWVTVR